MAKKTAIEMGREQKDISVSEFFEKNKHLLGFDNPTKALLMAVKEAVDNSLDACEEAGILPDLTVKVKNLKEDVYIVSIQDNGPGIVKEQISRIFGKLLYGSKFHRLRQSRGQQGIGISAVVLYSQLTTGVPTKIWSKVEGEKKVHYYELMINTLKNEPEIVKEDILEKGTEDHGIKVEMIVNGRYRKVQGIDEYLKETSIANPFAKIIYWAPDGTKMVFPRSVNELPKPPKEMKPHPYGVEFGILARMLKNTKSRTLSSFLTNEFSSVGAQSAKEICKIAKLNPDKNPGELGREETEKLLGGMQNAKVQRPPLDCLSPVGKEELEKSLKKEYQGAEFVTAIKREPEVYRGNPFQIEVGVVYGTGKEDAIDVIRFANRVPLMYQAGACAITQAVKEVDWKRYGVQQTGENIPSGPIVLVVHMLSVWVPFISESKEAVANYPEIIKEMKLAIQDAGRELSRFLSGKRRVGAEKRRLQIFDRYSDEVSDALAILTGKPKKEIEKKLKDLISDRSRLNEFAKTEEETSETEPKKESEKKEKKQKDEGEE